MTIAKVNAQRLDEIAAMLTESGVPIGVENSCHEGGPSCSPVMRLKWYLARRKSVSPQEVDQKLQQEMKEAEEAAIHYLKKTREIP